MTEDMEYETVSEKVRSFQSINPDGKSEQEYQETLRQVIRHLQRRVRGHASRKNLDTRIKYVPPERLGQTILPSLKRKLWSFSVALNVSNLQNDAKSWYGGILNHLADIDDLLEHIDTYIISIWRSYKPDQGYPVLVGHVPFRVKKIAEHVRELLERQLSQLFDAYHTFFEDFCLLNPWSNAPSSTKKGNTVYRRTALSTEKIDDVLESLEKSSLGLAREGWQTLVKEIDSSFKYPSKGPTLNLFHPDYPYGYEELILTMETTRSKSFQAATPVVKLCRVYFKKLVRPTNTQPLIFVAPSMNMTEDQLMQLVEHTKLTDSYVDNFVRAILHWPSELELVSEETLNLTTNFRELSPILEQYWNSLLESNDARVNQQAIVDARQWLESWKSLFSLATDNFIQITGCNNLPQRTIGAGETVVVDELNENDTEQSGGEDGSDGENGSGDEDQSDGEDRPDGEAESDKEAGLGGKEDADDKDTTE